MSETYDFTFSGAGSYTFEAHNLFHYVESAASSAVPIYAQTSAHEASISGSLATHVESLAELANGSTFFGCSIDQTNSLFAAIEFANNQLTNAVLFVAAVYFNFRSLTSSHDRYLKMHKGMRQVTARYITWFGYYEWLRYAYVWDKTEAILDYGFLNGTSPYTYNCSCTTAVTLSWVNPVNRCVDSS